MSALGFAIEDTALDHVPVRYLSFTWLCGGVEKTVEVYSTADPWFAADLLRKMADRIEEIEREAKEKGVTT